MTTAKTQEHLPSWDHPGGSPPPLEPKPDPLPLIFTLGNSPATPTLTRRNEGATLVGVITEVVSSVGIVE